jgi:hypothetical protein
MMTKPHPYTRPDGSTCAVKVFRQRCYTMAGTLGRPWPTGHVTYGGWRLWCLVCNAYEWSGRDVGSAMDGARAHCARHADTART